MEISVKSLYSADLYRFLDRAKAEDGGIVGDIKIGDHYVGFLKARSDGYGRLDIVAHYYNHKDFKYLKEFEVEYWDGDKAIKLSRNKEFLLELEEYLANDLEEEAIAFVQGTRLYKRYKSIFG